LQEEEVAALVKAAVAVAVLAVAVLVALVDN
jgi:hypothetical protein